VEAATPQEIESAFSSMNQQNAGAVIVTADAFFIQQGPQIADLARKHRMPSRDRLTSVLIPEGLY
jgi:hypothetical protein